MSLDNHKQQTSRFLSNLQKYLPVLPLPPRMSDRSTNTTNHKDSYRWEESKSHSIMDSYSGYRDPPPMRSPIERTGWGRDDSNYRERTSERLERAERPERERDDFYRGRSPGMSFFLFLEMIKFPAVQYSDIGFETILSNSLCRN